jgi:hypothetical protein
MSESLNQPRMIQEKLIQFGLPIKYYQLLKGLIV